jgi:hypothetical protein
MPVCKSEGIHGTCTAVFAWACQFGAKKLIDAARQTSKAIPAQGGWHGGSVHGQCHRSLGGCLIWFRVCVGILYIIRFLRMGAGSEWFFCTP